MHVRQAVLKKQPAPGISYARMLSCARRELWIGELWICNHRLPLKVKFPAPESKTAYPSSRRRKSA